MRKAARQEYFEEATRLRNQIHALQRIQDIALLNKSFVETPSNPPPIRASSRELSRTGRKVGVTRIEGYDISNLGSTGMVGSLVVFHDGLPDKNQYRKFKIKTVVGQSDVDCLEEVLRRRLKHTEWPHPDLFLIDGGKPQVNLTVRILKELRVAIPVVGLAKGPDRKNNEIVLGTNDKDIIRWVYANTRTLIAVRDEAHRFAITYQRQLRRIPRLFRHSLTQ